MERCCIIRVEKSPLSLNRKEQKGFLSSLNWGVIWGEGEDLEITLGADSRKLKSENKAKLFLSFPPLRKECSLGNFCPSRRGRATAGDRYLGPHISIWIISNSACLEPALWEGGGGWETHLCLLYTCQAFNQFPFAPGCQGQPFGGLATAQRFPPQVFCFSEWKDVPTNCFL